MSAAPVPAGSRAYVDASMDAVELLPVHGGRAAVFCAPRPEKKGPNEDAALVATIDPACTLLAVADGAGGMRGGDRASRIAIERVRERLAEAEPEDARARLVSALEDAHHSILSLGLGAATTFAGVLIDEQRLRSVHVGDSVVLVMGQRGRKRLQTVSHSPVGYAVEAGILDEREALDHEDLHLVSNLLGVGDPRIEISTELELNPRDTVVIGSDGLFDNVVVSEIVEAVRKGDLLDVTVALVERTLSRMVDPAAGRPSKPDDLSMIVYRPD
ncbi:MAG: PP2C family protein-serine/threonine phosphatase [Planctomycetota bacterium JB042]